MGFVTFENLHKVPKWDPIFSRGYCRPLYEEFQKAVKQFKLEKEFNEDLTNSRVLDEPSSDEGDLGTN